MKPLSRGLAALAGLGILVLVPAEAAAQRIQVQIPTPTPTPFHRAGFGGVAPSVVNVPVHSPDQLDFGGVWNGEKQVRTFNVTSNGKGFLNAEIPKGPFHIVEYREVGRPIRSPSGQKTSTNVTRRIPYSDSDSRALGWETEPDLQIQIDVVFNPKFDLVSMTAGDKTAALTLSGPGPMGAWRLAIPLHGVFHGVRLAATILVKDREPVIVRPAEAVDVAVDVISPGASVRGTLRGVNLPRGVTVDPVGVSVEAAKTTSTRVRVHAPAGGGFPENGSPHDVGLVLDGAPGAASAGFALSVVPPSIIGGTRREDCGLDWGVSAVLYASGKTTMTVSARNDNFVEAKEVWVEGKVGGVTFANALHIGVWVSPRSTKADRYTGSISPSDYLRAVRNPTFSFLCGGR